VIPRRWVQMDPGELAGVARGLHAEGVPDEGIVAQWEETLAQYVGVPYAAAVNSGRRGMALIFDHLGLGAGDEVIIPAYTLGDLVPLIQAFGAKVVCADTDPGTLNLTPETVEARMTPRTKAILVLHAFGAPCAIERIAASGARHGIPVIEDCAHSLGATSQGKQTGSFGYAAFFSFETTKPVNTFGGGMVVTRDAALIQHIRQKTAKDAHDLSSVSQKLRATRTEQRLFITRLGFPFLYLLATPSLKGLMNRVYRSVGQHAPPSTVRYSPVQAQLGLRKIATLPERIELRKHRAERLRSLLKPTIRTQQLEEGTESTWYFFVATLPRPVAPIRKKLLLRGIDAGVENEIADDCAALLGYADCPNVARVFSHAIALPMYDGIPEKSLARVARALNALV